MFNHSTRKALMSALAILTAATVGAVTPVTNADAAAEPGSQTYLLGAQGTPQGVSPRPAAGPAAPLANPNPPMLTLEVKDPVAAEKARVKTGTQTGTRTGLRAGTAQIEGEAGPYYCTPFVSRNIGSIGEDDYLEETVDVGYYGQVDCNIYLDSIEAVAGVFDRSAAFNGETFDGNVLGTGSYYYAEYAYTGSSAGGLGIRARDYSGGRKIEPGFEMFLLAPIGVVWGSCEPLVGLRYLACDGLGTDYLHILVGTGNVQTGLTKACRDQRGSLNSEQDRLKVVSGGTTPVSTQLIRRVPTVKDKLKAFKRDLCAQTTEAGATTFANQQGLDLWNLAVAAAKANVAQGDDRPLYWARLAMTAAFKQWRPTFTADRAALQTAVDKAARGMTSHTFGASSRRAFVSGFDPFFLDGSGIWRSNPSGGSVLRLDGASVAGAEVQAVIFPVRYDDFDAGLVEEIFRPHLQSGPQQATLITTVSQGGGRFDLEYYNGRRRSSTSPDNRNRTGGGTPDAPIPATNVGAGAEFVTTTLPVDRMLAGGAYGVGVNTVVREPAPVGQPPNYRDFGPSIGGIAVEGSGGGYLSNEIAYRVTRLRDSLGAAVPAGHVHTPQIWLPSSVGDARVDTERTAVATQYAAILAGGINNATVAPLRLVADRTSYLVGQTPVYTITGAEPSKAILWSSTRNGTLTTEVDASYGHTTNTSGAFTGSYHSWMQASTWAKYARINGRLVSVAVTVS